MTVFMLALHYDNGMSYEDNFYYDRIIGLYSSESLVKEALENEIKVLKASQENLPTKIIEMTNVDIFEPMSVVEGKQKKYKKFFRVAEEEMDGELNYLDEYFYYVLEIPVSSKEASK